MLLRVALTQRIADATPDPVELDYPKHLLEEWRVSPDKDGLLFSPVTFKGERVAQGAVETVTALVLDYDDGTAPEDAVAPWEAYDFVIYTTHSHRKVEPPKYNGEPRYRIVLPLAEPAEPAAFRALWAWAAFRAVGKIDPSCKDLFRRYYWPSHAEGAPDVFAFHNPGRLLSVADAPPVPGRPETRPNPGGGPTTKAGVLAALAALPQPKAAGAKGSGLFAGIGAARANGLRQVEDAEAIESRCAFLAHARDDAATLPEPEWYAALSVWARCEGGDDIAHARSEPHPGYSEDDTALKLERAKEHGPATCARVSEFFEGCKRCPHFGKVTSPVQLGAPDPATDAEGAAERAQGDVEGARDALALAKAGVDVARAAYREKQKASRYILDAAERAADIEPERKALEAAIEDRDRAAAFAKSAERKARELEAAASAPDGVEADVWRALKLSPATGAPVSCYSNIYKVVRLDPLFGPKLRTNMLGEVPEWGGAAIRDNDLSLACEYLSDTYGLEARLSDAKSAVAAVASRERYNPAAEYLRSLPAWDGTPRAPTLLADVLRADDTPDGLYSTYLRKFMVAAVRRAFEPGTKVDTMLVLQGPQGLKKSTFFEVLFGKAFVHDTAFEIGNKDAYGQIAHGWLYEWAELSGLTKREIDAVKNFISSAKDTYRMPYAHFAAAHPRHTVFGGTTNNPTPLNDPSGARRFWIIPLNERIDLALLGHLRAQLWAEAVARADAGELHWLEGDEEGAQRADALNFEEEDPRRVVIARWLDKRREPFFTADVCTALGMVADRSAARILGGHLRALGCVSRSLEGGTVRQWVPPTPAATATDNVLTGKFGSSGAGSKLFSRV